MFVPLVGMPPDSVPAIVRPGFVFESVLYKLRAEASPVFGAIVAITEVVIRDAARWRHLEILEGIASS